MRCLRSTLVFFALTIIQCIFQQTQGFTPSSSRLLTSKLSKIQNFRSHSSFVLKSSTNDNDDAEKGTEEMSSHQHTKNDSSDILLLPFDGSVADTSSWRSNLAIDVAYLTWPDELKAKDSKLNHYQLDDPNTDRSWIVNKLNALMQNLLSDQNGMTNCDAVLLTRLILEEQLLDNGRSVGKTGKYASKFHPNSISSDFDSDSDCIDENNDGSNQGSRPLTVGEITSNWLDGACLRDTVRIKYNIDRKDPIPIIKENIYAALELEKETNDNDKNYNRILPKVYPEIADAFSQCKGRVYIMVGDESHLTTALESLKQASISAEIQSIDEATKESAKLTSESASSQKNTKRIMLISPGEGERGHVGILQQMIMSTERGTSIHLIHPIVKTLQNARVLFGDNRPLKEGYGKCGIGSEVYLKLSLPTWADCAGVTEQNDVLMFSPYLNLCDTFTIPESVTVDGV